MFGLFGSRSNDKATAEALISAMHGYYESARTKFPGKKEIFYLSLAWALYAKKYHSEQYEQDDLVLLLIPASTETLIFSFLGHPESIDALAYFMVNKEKLRIAKEYEPKFNEIMSKLKISEAQLDEAVKETITYLETERKELESIQPKDFN